MAWSASLNESAPSRNRKTCFWEEQAHSCLTIWKCSCMQLCEYPLLTSSLISKRVALEQAPTSTFTPLQPPTLTILLSSCNTSIVLRALAGHPVTWPWTLTSILPNIPSLPQLILDEHYMSLVTKYTCITYWKNQPNNFTSFPYS